MGKLKVNGSIEAVGDIVINAANNVDRFLHFDSTDSTGGYDWRIGYLGTGADNANYLVFQSTGNAGENWTSALRFGLNDLNATFAGNILPSVNNSKTIGSSSYKWNNIYATTFTGNLSGTASKATNLTIADGSTNTERNIIVTTGATSGQNVYSVPGVTANYTKQTITAAGGFIGTLQGNASSASTCNGTALEWSGSIAWADTGWIAAWNADGTKIKALNKSSFAAASHSHSYLPLSGGTITGSVTFSKSNNYYDIATGTGGSILLNNGDIAGVNSIYFKDAANSVGEGLMFYRSATTVDALRAYNGVLYFSPNYDSAAGTQDGNYTVVHSGNYTNYQVNTDTKVQQSRSTSTNWRPLLSHYTATSQGTNPEAATNICYYNEKASIQPSTGKIYSAGGFIGNASSASSVPWSGITGKPSSYTPSSHTHSYLVSGGTASGSSHAAALKTWFTNNKASIPRNGLLNYYSSAYGNGSQYMGYFLSGYDSNPYGGFFVAHYQDPYYVGISNGNFVQQNIITSTNYSGYAVPLSGGTMSGGLAIVNHTQNNSYDALLFVSHHSTNEWGITIDKGGSYDYGLYINCGQGNYGLSLNGGLLLYSGVGYGSSFPSNPVTGRIFFKI